MENNCKADLQLFAEAPASGAGAQALTQPRSGEEAPAAAGSIATENTSQTDADSTAEEAQAKPSFDELIKGEYKAEFDAKVRDILQKRLKNLKQGQSAEKSAAGEEKRENSHREYTKILRGAEETKGVYPSFDLAGEMRNARFGSLILAGIDVKTAYEVTHKDEILPAAMRYSAEQAERKLTSAIASNSRRPMENAAGPSAASVSKPDPAKLTAQELADIRRRVQRGERIKF